MKVVMWGVLRYEVYVFVNIILIKLYVISPFWMFTSYSDCGIMLEVLLKASSSSSTWGMKLSKEVGGSNENDWRLKESFTTFPNIRRLEIIFWLGEKKAGGWFEIYKDWGSIDLSQEETIRHFTMKSV